jgi:hypothetical protein
VARDAINERSAVDNWARLWITRGQEAAAVAPEDEVLDDDEFDFELLADDFALESDEEDEAGVDGFEPPSLLADAVASALTPVLASDLASDLALSSDLLSVR